MKLVIETPAAYLSEIFEGVLFVPHVGETVYGTKVPDPTKFQTRVELVVTKVQYDYVDGTVYVTVVEQ